jgi:putative flavoprotein involved in K+ transport
MAVKGTTAQCSGGLANLAKNADLKQARLFGRVDEYVAEHGIDDQVGTPTDAEPTRLGDAPTEIDLTAFSTVIWATGYRPRYPWLPAAAFDVRGRPAHDGGVGALPGLYFLGLPFLRRRRSNLIAGLGVDAADLGDHLCTYLDCAARTRRTLTLL